MEAQHNISGTLIHKATLKSPVVAIPHWFAFRVMGARILLLLLLRRRRLALL